MLYFIYISYKGEFMGIVKISDPLHEEIRKSSQVMSRSINAQAEFWLKMGRLAELHPTLTFNEIIQKQMQLVNADMPETSDSEIVNLR